MTLSFERGVVAPVKIASSSQDIPEIMKIIIEVSEYTDPLLLFVCAKDLQVILKERDSIFADWERKKTEWYDQDFPPAILLEILRDSKIAFTRDQCATAVQSMLDVYDQKGMNVVQVGICLRIKQRIYALLVKSSIPEKSKESLIEWARRFFME